MSKTLKLLAISALLAAVAAPGAAEARTHVFLGFGFGVPAYPAYPAYYYPPPVYYAPPPVYYAPPPPVVVYTPPQPVYVAPAPAPAPTASNCRQFNGDATIDASGRPFYGTACLGPDGRWHIQ